MCYHRTKTFWIDYVINLWNCLHIYWLYMISFCDNSMWIVVKCSCYILKNPCVQNIPVWHYIINVLPVRLYMQYCNCSLNHKVFFINNQNMLTTDIQSHHFRRCYIIFWDCFLLFWNELCWSINCLETSVIIKGE